MRIAVNLLLSLDSHRQSYILPIVNKQQVPSDSISVAGFSPEASLVFACANPFPDKLNKTAIAALLNNQPDWSSVIALAKAHKTTPLLFKNLQAFNNSQIPAIVMSKLEQAYLVSASRHVFLIKHLFDLVATFAEAGIKALPWKGPSIAASLYPDPHTRPCDDLDFLIHPDDIFRAVDLFTKKGYAPHLPITPRILKHYLNAELDYVASNSLGDLWIDLSTSPAPKHFALEINKQTLWSSTATVTVEDTIIPSPCPEHLLLLLSIHASKHCWRRLLWTCDIAAVLHGHQQLNWDTMIDLARKQGALRVVLVGLQLARSLMKSELPGKIVEMIEGDKKTLRLVNSIVAQMQVAHASTSAGMQEFRIHMRMRERIVDRIRHAIRLALTPSYGDWISLPLGESLSFLYWFTRPFRLAAKNIKQQL